MAAHLNMHSFIIYSERPGDAEAIPHPALSRDKVVHISEILDELFKLWDYTANSEELIDPAIDSHRILPIMKKFEKYILMDPVSTCRYALDIRQREWPEAEPFMLTNKHDCGRAIDKFDHAYWLFRYARDIKKTRWPEAEPIIQKGGYRLWHDYMNAFPAHYKAR